MERLGQPINHQKIWLPDKFLNFFSLFICQEGPLTEVLFSDAGNGLLKKSPHLKYIRRSNNF